jgi:predicted  nucleic acid-binding Zn-ribbon protein
MAHRSTMRHSPPGGLTLTPVKASPQIQLRLLELADLDTELNQLARRRASLPEIASLAQLQSRHVQLKDSIVVAETALADLGREEVRAERDVDQVRSRIDKDQARLDAGQVGAARELAGLQSEIESLHKRQADLEEVVLDLMERRERIEAERDALVAERDGVGSEAGGVTSRRDAAFAEIDAAAGAAGTKRAEVVADIPADLLALYDKIRASSGVGAAMLRGGRCEGCHVSLSTVDLNAIKATAADEVVRCEECRRILVRTAESGL